MHYFRVNIPSGGMMTDRKCVQCISYYKVVCSSSLVNLAFYSRWIPVTLLDITHLLLQLLRPSDGFAGSIIRLVCVVGCVAQWAERRSLAGELTLSCARPAADG